MYYKNSIHFSRILNFKQLTTKKLVAKKSFLKKNVSYKALIHSSGKQKTNKLKLTSLLNSNQNYVYPFAGALGLAGDGEFPTGGNSQQVVRKQELHVI